MFYFFDIPYSVDVMIKRRSIIHDFMIAQALSLRTKHIRDFFFKVAQSIVTFFTQTLKAYISWTNWLIDLNFFMVTSFDLVYWYVKFQEIEVNTTTRTSLPTQKFQNSVAVKIFYDIFWNYAWTTIQPLDKSWVSCTAIM